MRMGFLFFLNPVKKQPKFMEENAMKLSLLLMGLAGIFLTGCVSLNEEKVSPEAPVSLHPPARELLNADPASLYFKSLHTVTDIPLRSRTIQHVAEVAGPAVVSVYVRTETPVTVRLLPIKLAFTGISAKLPGIGLGSGFFIHPSGYILSNAHVIHNAAEIRVMTKDGLDFAAHVVAADPVYDLALLKIDAPKNTKFPFLKMGDSDELRIGDQVIAIGNPLGLGHTVTSGIISHPGRSLFEEKEPNGRYVRYLQTDAAINSGSSGGPLITLTGAWIGLNTAKLENSQGIGFTVPSHLVQEFLNNVLKGNGTPIK